MILFLFFGVLAAGSLGDIAEPVERSFVIAKDFNIKIRDGKTHFHIHNKENGEVLRGELGVRLPEKMKSPQVCADDQNCLQFDKKLKLTVNNDDHCTYLEWTTSDNITIADCFDYSTDNWYGGPESNQQYWPFNNMTFNESSYITKMEFNQGVAAPYWVTSSGYYVYVDKITPLFIDARNIYSNGLCLMAKQAPPYLPRGATTLKYKICKYKNTRAAHKIAVQNDLGKPSGVPDKRMIEHPVWSTWVRFKLDVNETSVRQFAQEVMDSGFNNSQLEIDDNWETCYGSAQFNKSRFPTMPKLGTDLHKMGFRVTLWNHPFVNTNCALFKTLKNKGYLVKDQTGNVVSTWWDGQAGVVDFTNPKAAQWYLKRRRTMMRQNKIDGLKLDAGESSWLPQIPNLNADINDQPNAFTTAYVRTVAQFGGITEVRAGHNTQNTSIFVRMLDKDSKWTFENGLPTLITTLLQLNLNGYTLVLPDMVGGNAYNTDVVTKELFIRWLQANVFMPAIQFSAAPWDFDNETIEISKKYTALHYEYSQTILNQMQASVDTGAPVNTPIWWVAPRDKVAHGIWSEYMLGNNILVAPVVEKGAVTRDIYLPWGRWRDMSGSQNKIYYGPRWVRNYPAPLDTLPYFIRIVHQGKDNYDIDEDNDF